MIFKLPRIVDDDARDSFHGKSSTAVGHRICRPSRIIQLLSVIQNKQQQNNTTTINFFPEKVFKNLEDTAEKALAQY